MDRDGLEEPGVVEDDADGTFSLGVFLAVTTYRVSRSDHSSGWGDGPCRTMPSGVGKNEKPLRGLGMSVAVGSG